MSSDTGSLLFVGIGSGILFVGSVALAALLHLYGVRQGNASTPPSGEFPWWVLSAVLVAPPVEEALCRLLPFELASFVQAPLLPVGILTAALFALLHMVRWDRQPLSVAWERPALTQFAFGLWAWYLLVAYGFWAAVLAHALFNAAAVSVLLGVRCGQALARIECGAHGR